MSARTRCRIVGGFCVAPLLARGGNFVFQQHVYRMGWWRINSPRTLCANRVQGQHTKFQAIDGLVVFTFFRPAAQFPPPLNTSVGV